MMLQSQIPQLPDDGLVAPEVGPWVETKYRLVDGYNRLFSKGMKRKWHCRVYIDLYAGSGRSKIRGTNRIISGSPLLALSVPDRFDKYIFCEANATYLAVLQQRVHALRPDTDVRFISGDCNLRIDEIRAEIPMHSPGHKVLSFCFMDPYRLDIQFATVQALSQRYIDFMLLLALDMDARRNEDFYSQPDNSRVDEFLGVPDWRDRWSAARAKGMPFQCFLAQEYASRMETLGYKKVPLAKMKEVRSHEKNLPLYHLAFFSRHDLGYKLWNEVLRYRIDQQSLGI